MSEEFSNRTAKLPFLDINEKSFDSIYGNKNPYIAIYLNYMIILLIIDIGSLRKVKSKITVIRFYINIGRMYYIKGVTGKLQEKFQESLHLRNSK
ncbi:hypothetical protein EW093_05545 [Thiospirochaeta perfilievii]|uniref:Uncharacterized protein n=1 Tax=Thiospirochaeta perfilievii TaxID=252967 RepID=A0A5C1QBE6_9SPIO|nr:hypothetical protein [Thiospirochaeta perfilievii]QEN04189.1 hypothetical protein EW093_05545 [Thiospirochaeta perfilievii]